MPICMPIKRIALLLPLILILALAACQSAAAPTGGPSTQPAEPAVQPVGTNYPAGEQQVGTNYPASEQPEIQAQPTLPADYPGPAQAPAVDNRSYITATLIEQAPDAQDPNYIRLKVNVISSAIVDNSPEFTSKLVGTDADLYVLSSELPAIVAGDTFEAQVTYVGDEAGGRYLATNVSKVE